MMIRILTQEIMRSCVRVSIILMLFVCFILPAISMAETEPNNTKATANTLNIDIPGNFSINSSSDPVDWIKCYFSNSGQIRTRVYATAGCDATNLYWIIYPAAGDPGAMMDADKCSNREYSDWIDISAGWYYLYIDYSTGPADNDYYTATFYFRVDTNNTKATADILTIGATGNFSINSSSDPVDWIKCYFSSSGQMRTRVYATAGCDATNLYWIIYPAAGDPGAMMDADKCSNREYSDWIDISAGWYYLHIDYSTGPADNDYYSATFYYQAGVNQAPTLVITSPNSDKKVMNATTTHSFSGTASDSDGTVVSVEYRVRGGAWQTATGTTSWSFNVSGLLEGANLVEVRCRDNSDLYSDIQSRTITRNVIPTVAITTPGSDQTIPNAQTTFAFSGTAADSDGSVSKIEYRIRGGAWQTATGTTSWNFTATGLVEGTNLIEVASIDNDTDKSALQSRTITRKTKVVDWCNLQWPPSGAISLDEQLTVYGWVYEPGVTVGQGQGQGIEAQAGLGDYLTSPAVHSSWQWFNASYNMDYDGLFPGDLANDEYMADLIPWATGKYSYCFRFRISNEPWEYGDLDGSDNGYSADQAGVLTVEATPTPTPTPTPVPFRWGDVCCPLDNKAGTKDASAILRWNALLDDSFPCFDPPYVRPNFPPGGDVNGDGKMGTLDASEVLKYNALLITCFPADTDCDGFGPDEGNKGLKIKYGTKSEANDSYFSEIILGINDNIPCVPGGESVVSVQVSDSKDIIGYRIVVNYDKNELSFVKDSVDKSGTLTSSFSDPVANDTVEGRLIISCAGTEALTGGAGALIKFKLKAAADALGAIPVTFDQSLTEINDGGIQAGFDDGSIDVQPPSTPTITPTVTPIITPTPIPVVLSIAENIPCISSGEAVVNVHINESKGVVGYRIVVNYDKTKLSYVKDSVDKNGTLTSSFSDPVVNDTVEGRLIISCAGTEALTGGAGALIKFKINAAADALGAIPLTFDQSLTEINDGGIQAGFDDGSIDVQPPVTPTVTPTITPTPTPTMSPTPTPTPAPPTQPHGRPVLHIELDKPSTIPGGGTIRYKYEWTSSGGDMPVVHGPKNETEALLRHGDGGATFDEGETWTVTVTPYNDANQPGQSFSAKFIFGKDQVTFTGWLMR